MQDFAAENVHFRRANATQGTFTRNNRRRPWRHCGILLRPAGVAQGTRSRNIEQKFPDEMFTRFQKELNNLPSAFMIDGIMYIRSCTATTEGQVCGANAPVTLDPRRGYFFRGDSNLK